MEALILAAFLLAANPPIPGSQGPMTSDGTAWRPVTGQAQWLPRNGHASVVFRNRMWVIGGWSHFIGGTSVNDLWSSGG